MLSCFVGYYSTAMSADHDGPKSFYYEMRKDRDENSIQCNTAFRFPSIPDKKHLI